MKGKPTGLSRRYEGALRKHLRQGRRVSLRRAQGLGRRAMAIGLETLELARIHEQALIKLVLPAYSARIRNSMVRRAGIFFAEAITQIGKAHRITRETNAHLSQTNHSLRQRTLDLTASNRQLKQEIARRKLAEEAFRKSQQHYDQLLNESRYMQDQLRLLSRQLLSAQEDERKKISRELHDVIAQTLTSINLRLSALKKAAALDAKGIERSIARTQKLVEHSVNIVHQFARELRPTALDDLGLIPALQSFLKGFKEETGIHVRLSAFASVEEVNGDKRTVLYRVAQEALNNIARHAQASLAEVRIEKRDGAICMKVKDNGKGFAAERVLHANRQKRLGLIGMRERLEMVSGHFSITSTPSKGTTVLAHIPLANHAPKRESIMQPLWAKH